MKKILSLILAFSFFASEASFMDKVKALPGTVKGFALSAKEFGTKTIDAAKANKPKAIFTTLQLAVVAHRLYVKGMPKKELTLFTEDKDNFFGFGENSPLGTNILKLYGKAGNPETIKNKSLRPITYVQNFFNEGIGGTLFILEILKRLTAKAE
jgi:hypothetical protein